MTKSPSTLKGWYAMLAAASAGQGDPELFARAAVEWAVFVQLAARQGLGVSPHPEAWPAALVDVVPGQTPSVERDAAAAADCRGLAQAAARWIDTAKARPDEILGGVHAQLVGRGRRKGTGVFYTPAPVADAMVAGALDRWAEAGTPVRWLDPACGSGAFLLAGWRWLRRRAADAGAALAGIHGIDRDRQAVLAARRSLWLAVCDDRKLSAVERNGWADRLARQIVWGDSLAGPATAGTEGTWQAVLGNPPYRRERGAKEWLDQLAATDLGRRWRAPRMDVWYYFAHRGLELLAPGGVLSFIVSHYWTHGCGAEKLRQALRDAATMEEIILLDRLPVFAGVAGRHLIFRAVKRMAGAAPGRTVLRRMEAGPEVPLAGWFSGAVPVHVWEKPAEALFAEGCLDLTEDGALAQRLAGCTALGELAVVRQGIAENPATVTRKTNERYGGRWRTGQGVFTLTADELSALDLSAEERRLVRPYHDLADLGRHQRAETPSRWLLYLTAETCPEIAVFPSLLAHLEPFRPVLAARRETRSGKRAWWQLHWPREERWFLAPKILAIQMARRPEMVACREPTWFPFSVNAVIPPASLAEHLFYLAGWLNSRLMAGWFAAHAKPRGVGLEINGHLLARVPVRRIDWNAPRQRSLHDRIVERVGQLQWIACDGSRQAERESLDAQIDAAVEELCPP